MQRIALLDAAFEFRDGALAQSFTSEFWMYLERSALKWCFERDLLYCAFALLLLQRLEPSTCETYCSRVITMQNRSLLSLLSHSSKNQGAILRGECSDLSSVLISW